MPYDTILRVFGKQMANHEANAKGTRKGERKRHEGGVRPFFLQNRPNSPFALQWRVDGKRKTESFATATDRDNRVRALRKERKANTLGLVPTRAELMEWQAFKTAIGNANWREVVVAWKKGGGSEVQVTVREIVQAYLAEQDKRLAKHQIVQATYSKNCHKAKAFDQDFSAFAASQIAGREIEEWIDSLGHTAAETFNTYRKVVHAVFAHSKKHCPVNPISDIRTRKTIGEIEILTVDETRKLLEYASENYPQIVLRLALECFAGLRFSSAWRIAKAEIDFVEEGIRLPAEKMKTGTSHFIDKLPENLWKWLRIETDETWTITHRNYGRLKSRCFTEAGVKHPHNCLRHSFCTYHAAAFKDTARTATILCHRGQQVLWTNYKGLASSLDGIRYFEIFPSIKKTT